MRSNTLKARGYRERAAELRAIAQDWRELSAREALLNAARDYEFMAERLERLPELARA